MWSLIPKIYFESFAREVVYSALRMKDRRSGFVIDRKDLSSSQERKGAILVPSAAPVCTCASFGITLASLEDSAEEQRAPANWPRFLGIRRKSHSSISTVKKKGIFFSENKQLLKFC